MIRSKKCFKCNTVQPLSEFYKHSEMADGHLNKCKTCAKNDVLIHRKENLETIRAYDRKRGKLAHRIALRTIVTKAWRAEDKRRAKAHNVVRRSILNGKLVKANCERCGNEKSVAHHEDYDKPLQIIWLCTVCHKQRHKEIKEKTMSSNAFPRLEREYNEREEAREMARAEREQVGPCPFCRNPEPTVDEIEVGIWAICCDTCKAIGPHQDGEQSPQIALNKWNRK